VPDLYAADSQPKHAERCAERAPRVSPRRLRVLLAEGRSGVAASCLQSLFPRLEESLDLSVVASVATMLSMTKVSNPEVMLLDLSLARPDPRDTVRRLHRSIPGVPLIVFADAQDKDYAAQCLTEGAMDYLLKHLAESVF
jgi:DNA-binding NarL/FixJ family response regulator